MIIEEETKDLAQEKLKKNCSRMLKYLLASLLQNRATLLPFVGVWVLKV